MGIFSRRIGIFFLSNGSNVSFGCLATIHYIKASRRLRGGFAECRVAYAENNFPQVPTRRLRGPTMTGRQPAGAFVVKMHSKRNAAHG